MSAGRQIAPPGRARSTAALGAALGIALWLTGAGAAKGGVLIGTPDGSSFVPFGGLTAQLVDVLTEDFPGDPNFDPTLVPRFQQVYSSSAFASPLTISLIEFFEFNPPAAPGSALLGGTFTLQLSTTALSLDGLACCDAVSFDSNLGGDDSGPVGC